MKIKKNRQANCDWCGGESKVTFFKDNHNRGWYCKECKKLVKLCGIAIDRDNELEILYDLDEEKYNKECLNNLALAFLQEDTGLNINE